MDGIQDRQGDTKMSAVTRPNWGKSRPGTGRYRRNDYRPAHESFLTIARSDILAGARRFQVDQASRATGHERSRILLSVCWSGSSAVHVPDRGKRRSNQLSLS